MKKFLNKIFVTMMLVVMAFACAAVFDTEVSAAPKKKGKGGLNQEQLETMNTNLNMLTRKIYANSLFSPADNETLINIKLDLDGAMLKQVSPEYAPLYWLEGNLLKKRSYKNEAIECYQTILENFADTAFAPKARQELLKMGVTIAEPEIAEEEEEE